MAVYMLLFSKQILLFSLLRRIPPNIWHTYVPSAYLTKELSNNDDLNVSATAKSLKPMKDD